MRTRKTDFVKPEGLSMSAWLFRLEADKRDLLAQVRREVHTRGFAHGAYANRLDRAIAFARAEMAKAPA